MKNIQKKTSFELLKELHDLNTSSIQNNKKREEKLSQNYWKIKQDNSRYDEPFL